MNTWVRNYQSYVPSVEAIQNVNIATNANDAEQGIAGGASVNVMLKSGTNATHGGGLRVQQQFRCGGQQLLRQRGRPKEAPAPERLGLRRLCRRAHHPQQAVLLRQLRTGQCAPIGFGRPFLPQPIDARGQFERFEHPHLRPPHGEPRWHGQDTVPRQHHSHQPPRPGHVEDHSQHPGHQCRRPGGGDQQLLHQPADHLSPAQDRHQAGL